MGRINRWERKTRREAIEGHAMIVEALVSCVNSGYTDIHVIQDRKPTPCGVNLWHLEASKFAKET